MEIRRAKAADQPAISGLVIQVLDEFALPHDPQGIDQDLEDLEGFYQKTGGGFWVVTEEEKVIGCAGLLKISAQVCELRKMYLLPQARGRGLGKTLLNKLLAWSREAGFESMELETAGVLKTAIGLYRSYGFVDQPNRQVPTRCDQAMSLDLRETP